jgi:hypothetical protein
MAAPVYLQQQIVAMIATPKRVDYNAWQNRYEGRAKQTEERSRIEASPIDENDLTEFEIETCRCPAREEASFTLFGKLIGCPQEPLCRYEVQWCRHTNPRWFPPAYIGLRELHKHVYNERAIRENWPWDKCAELLNVKKKPKKQLSLQQCIERLGGIFLDETHTTIDDPASRDLFYKGK